VALYSLEERKRLHVKPGLTCFWQIQGRSDIPFKDQVRLDLQYIVSRSFWLDLWIIIKTVPAVLLGKGAY
jgi:lipopolysaccharide/colanic/teichoic acid biosynthesis glycosyltransferase